MVNLFKMQIIVDHWVLTVCVNVNSIKLRVKMQPGSNFDYILQKLLFGSRATDCPTA